MPVLLILDRDPIYGIEILSLLRLKQVGEFIEGDEVMLMTMIKYENGDGPWALIQANAKY
jgi:hypothetical protein